MIYVFTDPHGNKEAWNIVRDAMHPSDKLIVLGDACDRGRYGVEILSEMMEDPRVDFIIGNHDDWIIRVFRPDLVHNSRRSAYWAERCWCQNTGPSINEWKKLREENPEKFNRLVEWLANCDVFRTMRVNGMTYRLAHAKYPKEMDNVAYHMSWKDMEQDYTDLLQSTIWDRYDRDGVEEDYVTKGAVTFIGHTPISAKNREVFKGVYNLDSGLGYGENEIYVACLERGTIYSLSKGYKLPAG